jgi:hypothetical protein
MKVSWKVSELRLKSTPGIVTLKKKMQVSSMIRSSCARRFPPKIIITRFERGVTIKDRRECGEGLFGLWSGRSDPCGTVKGAETARKGCGNVEGPKRVRLEEESRKSKPRRRGADLRITDGRFVKNQTPECGIKYHAWISSSTVGQRKSPRNVQRRRQPRDDQGQGDRKKKLFSRSQRVVSGKTFFLFCSG